MADNVTLPGTGVVTATDDVGGAHYQRLKLDLGADGASSPLVRGQQAAADSLPVVLASDAGDVLDVTLSLDTGIYGDGDVLADTQTLSNAVRVSGGRCWLQSVVALDESDQGFGFDLIFLNANNALGTENSAPNISDANARAIIGRVPIAAADFYDLGGCRVACITNIGLPMEASGSRDLYMAAIARGAGTYAADGIRLKLGVIWE